MQIKTLDEIERGAAMQMDAVIAPVLQVKFHFMGCLVKANTLVPGNRSSLSSQLIVC